jgi:putative component of membrane protein insertase Oxa1/YidC/SpoIIIJ protein YidD
MTSLALRSSTSVIAVSAIGFYQRWLSPYKGYHCAHHALYGQGSCSGFGLKVFREHPADQAWKMLRERFTECRAASQMLMTQHQERRKKSRGSAAQSGSDCGCDDSALEAFCLGAAVTECCF